MLTCAHTCSKPHAFLCGLVQLGGILFVHLVFPKDAIAYKQMQNSVMLKLFSNVISHVGPNLSFQNKCCSRINSCN